MEGSGEAGGEAQNRRARDRETPERIHVGSQRSPSTSWAMGGSLSSPGSVETH